MKKYGLLAGISLLLMALTAGFAFGYAHPQLMDAATDSTLAHFQSLQKLFFAELGGWIFILLLDIIVALSLYVYFRDANKTISMLTAALRLLYTLLLGLAIWQLFRIIPFFSQSNLQNQEVQALLESFNQFWSLGLIVFGWHLLGLGILAHRTRIPKLLVYLLYIAAIGYFLIHMFRQLQVWQGAFMQLVEQVLSIPMTLAELVLAIWFIYMGLRKNAKTSHSF